MQFETERAGAIMKTYFVKTWLATAAIVLAATSAYAHVTVTPQQSSAGGNQIYKIRIHTEGKMLTKGIELQVPAEITVVEVGKPPAGTYEAVKTGSRITAIKWTIDITPGKMVELPFTATNTTERKDINWTVKQVLADGRVEDWTGKPGTFTKLNAAAAAASAKKEFAFRGKVTGVNAQARTLAVANENIPGWMAPMTMSYAVDKPDVLGKLKVGDQITAKVYEGDVKTLYGVAVVVDTPEHVH
jgi:uncharacterized protein YcnI